MSKTATLPTKATLYRPHKRITFNSQVDPVTGEVVPSATKQEFKAECDINNILKQYKATGMIRHIAAQGPIYADLPSDIDFQGSLNMVLEAQTAFGTLPSKIRERFANDPRRFLAFMADPSNLDEMVKLGLAKKTEEAPPPPPPPAPPPEEKTP